MDPLRGETDRRFGDDRYQCVGPSGRHFIRRVDSAATSTRVGFRISDPMGSDLSRRIARCRVGVPRAHYPALGEFAMALIFDRGWHRYRDNGCRILRLRGRTASGWLASIPSLGPAYAHTIQMASQYGSSPAYQRRLGYCCRGGRVFGFLSPGGDMISVHPCSSVANPLLFPATRSIASRLRSTSVSLVAQDDTLMRVA